jgi:photosystem II stability/assembly factor-like uncharacterized protein
LRKIAASCCQSLVFLLFSFVASFAQSTSADFYNGLQWRLIGPFRGGRAIAAAGIPGNPATFYFGAVNGGIWRSDDAGIVWRPIFDSQHIASVGALAIAPSDSKIIYAGTGEADIRSDLSSGDGVYKSVDGGQAWANLGLHDSRQISRIVIDPRDANIVYVAVLGHAYGPNEERGVFKTTDGGAHWNKVLDRGPDIGVADLALATNSPNILFAAAWKARRPPWSVYGPLGGPGSQLYRSTDGGQSWSPITGHGLPESEWGRPAVAVSPDGKRVYALVDTKPSSAAGLYRSDDGGSTWSLANSDPRLIGRSWYFGNLTIDPNNPDVVYIPNVALYRSEDAGKTISIVRAAPGGDDYHQIWVDPKDSKRMILATDQGTSISVNYGTTWSSWNNQPTAQIYHVITDDKFPYAVYGTQQDSGGIGVMSRTDHGQIDGRDWFSPGGSESGYVAPDPQDPDIVYTSASYGGVYRFDRRTSFSQDITPWPVPLWGTDIAERKYRAPWNPVLLFSTFDKKTLYLGTQFVMKTTDGGLHWQEISPDLTGATTQANAEGPPTVENAKQRGYGAISTLAPSALNSDTIWAGSDTGLVHLTRDAGKTWTDVTPKGVPLWSRISFIEASRFDPGTAYVAVDRHRLDDQQPYLYRTRDYGASWQPITNGIAPTSFARAIRQDSQNRNLLFAGTELGIYVSFDDGEQWQSLQLNLPVTSVQDMVIHGDDLVIGTHGRSFWILDDITSLREVTEAGKSAAWLYSPAAAVRVDNDLFQGTPLPPEEPSAKNPPDGAIIDYYLRSPVGHVQLQVLDAQGHTVRSFSSDEPKNVKHPPVAVAERWFPEPQVLGTTSGMHRFVWDLTWNPEKGAVSETAEDEEYGAPRGPRVPAGSYELRLIVDGNVLKRNLKVTMDPRSTATPAELDEQYKLGQKMFVEAMRARTVLAEIHSVQAKLDAAAAGSQAASGASEVQDAIKKILNGNRARAGEPMGLETASGSLASVLRVVESGNRTAPSQALAVFDEADRAAKQRIGEWEQLKKDHLPQLDKQLK